jgi:hypothetical protein
MARSGGANWPAPPGTWARADDLLGYLRHFTGTAELPRPGPWAQAVLVRTIGGKRLPDPFGVARVLSAGQRQELRARVRARLTRRPVVRIEN